MKLVTGMLVVSSCFAGLAMGQATTVAPAKPVVAERKKLEPNLGGWWNDAVFYHVFVRSFADSTTGPLANDGVGDLQGLIERLDYLNDGNPSTTDDLGITALWLMPIMPSPSYHGYDITDYKGINADYGTLDDFKRLKAECDKRGIKIVLDMVLNHCSNEHEWFKKAAADPSENNPYRNYFIWSKEKPTWKGPWGQDVWWPAGDSFYYGLFWHGMPDLNYRNPEVTKTMEEMQRWWLKDMGIAGFRLDAIRHLIEDGAQQDNTPETHAWLRDYYKFYKSVNPEAFTVGEVWAGSDVVSTYVGDQMDIAFEFDLAGAMIASARDGNKGPVENALKRIAEFYPKGQYGTFLANHDQNRVLSQLGGPDYIDKADVAAALQFTLPGVPFVYYGEEVGMIGEKPDEKIRTPMQWTAERFGGFSKARPWQPANSNGKEFNVAVMRADKSSLWNQYDKLIDLRVKNKTLRTGEVTLLETSSNQVLSYARHDDKGRFLIVANLGAKPISEYTVTLPDGVVKGASKATEVLQGKGPAAAPKAGAYTPEKKLEAETVYVFTLD